MLILKLKFHLKSLFLKWIYRLLYLKKFQFGTRLTFRDGFHLVVEKSGKVIIGNRVFFNNFCSINAMLSVTIGDNSIIGAGVVVYQDVPENSIILSNGEIRKYG